MKTVPDTNGIVHAVFDDFGDQKPASAQHQKPRSFAFSKFIELPLKINIEIGVTRLVDIIRQWRDLPW